MTPYYTRDNLTLRLGNCLHIMAGMAENSIDTVITDPPAGIAFMGKKWDNKTGYQPYTDKGAGVLAAFSPLLQPWEAGFLAFIVDYAFLALRVAKPGAINLTWAIPRTSDLTQMGLRLAGWEIRDTIYHCFGSGFPKSHDISKAIDRAAIVDCARCNGTGWVLPVDDAVIQAFATEHEMSEVAVILGFQIACETCGGSGKVAGAEREVVGPNPYNKNKGGKDHHSDKCAQAGKLSDITAPATPAAKLWDGYGTALKPAVEEWIVAMKPLDGTFAQNALEWGVAGLWVDGGRVGTTVETWPKSRGYEPGAFQPGTSGAMQPTGEAPAGRWPSNLILSYPNDAHDADGNLLPNPEKDEVLGCFPVTKSGSLKGKYKGTGGGNCYGDYGYVEKDFDASEGSAARFFKHCPPDAKRVFYAAKASRRERDKGLGGLPKKPSGAYGEFAGDGRGRQTEHAPARNTHETVKPLSLMRYLCTLTRTPTGGVVLDPFAGSGTTGVACVWTDRDFIGIETDSDYAEIAKRRIDAALDEPKQAKLF